MNIWEFIDRNGFGIAFVIVVVAIVGTVGGLALAGKIGGGPTLCTIPCAEVKAR